jgi:hypothetical protein
MRQIDPPLPGRGWRYAELPLFLVHHVILPPVHRISYEYRHEPADEREAMNNCATTAALAGMLLAGCSTPTPDDWPSGAPALGAHNPGLTRRILRDMCWADRTQHSIRIQDLPLEQATSRLMSLVKTRPLGQCLGAAELLWKIDDERARAAVRGLLSSRDALVRRVAAEFVFGEEALSAERARVYGYAPVLETEERAAACLKAIAEGTASERAVAESRIASLGRDALWILQRELRSRTDLAFGLAVAHLTIRVSSDPPDWWREVRAALEKRIEPPGAALDLQGHLALIRQYIPITYRPFPGAEPAESSSDRTLVAPAGETPPPTIGAYLDAVCAAYDLIQSPVPGGMVVCERYNIDGTIGHLIDVRDIERADPVVDWRAVVDAASPGGERRRRVMGEYEETLAPLGGFLYMTTRTHQDDVRGDAPLAELRGRLEAMRAERGIPPVAGDDAAADGGYSDTSLWPDVGIE